MYVEINYIYIYHIALGKDLRVKTAFVMPFGKYEFLQVPFGLAQAPAFFQHLMNIVNGPIT